MVRRDGGEVLFLNQVRHAENSALLMRVPIAQAETPAVAALLGQRGRFAGRDYRGSEVLAELRAIPDSPWCLVAKVDSSEVLAEARYRAFVSVFGVTLLVLMTGGATAYAYRLRRDAERRRVDNLRATRLRILEQATLDMSIDDLLKTTVDEARRLTASPIGFFHVVAAAQNALTLQAWSHPAAGDRPEGDPRGRRCDLYRAGRWADALRLGHPITLDASDAGPNAGESPDGRTTLARCLVVPIFRGPLVVALLGVANGASAYGPDDVASVTQVADLAWDVVGRRQAEAAKSELEQLRVGQRSNDRAAGRRSRSRLQQFAHGDLARVSSVSARGHRNRSRSPQSGTIRRRFSRAGGPSGEPSHASSWPSGPKAGVATRSVRSQRGRPREPSRPCFGRPIGENIQISTALASKQARMGFGQTRGQVEQVLGQSGRSIRGTRCIREGSSPSPTARASLEGAQEQSHQSGFRTRSRAP